MQGVKVSFKLWLVLLLTKLWLVVIAVLVADSVISLQSISSIVAVLCGTHVIDCIAIRKAISGPVENA